MKHLSSTLKITLKLLLIAILFKCAAYNVVGKECPSIIECPFLQIPDSLQNNILHEKLTFYWCKHQIRNIRCWFGRLICQRIISFLLHHFIKHDQIMQHRNITLVRLSPPHLKCMTPVKGSLYKKGSLLEYFKVCVWSIPERERLWSDSRIFEWIYPCPRTVHLFTPIQCFIL